MIVALMAAALASSAHGPQMVSAASCHDTPTLCLVLRGNGTQDRSAREDRPRPDGKWDAFRFNARPCRLIGNLDCPRRGQRQIFRLGEPIGQTLLRSFGLD